MLILVICGAAVAPLAIVPIPSVLAAGSTYNSIAFSPDPIAAAGSLAAGQQVTVCVVPEDNGTPITGQVQLSLTFTSGAGGSASLAGTPLGSAVATPETSSPLSASSPCGSFENDQVVPVTYGAPPAPSSLPASGTDVLSAENPAGTITTTDIYSAVNQGASPGVYHPMAPTRICDTRPFSQVNYTTQCTAGGPVGPGSTLPLISPAEGEGPGPDGLPSSGVTAVVVNLTAIVGSQAGYLSVYPSGEPRPTIESLSFPANQTLVNLATVGVGTQGDIAVYNALGTVNVVLDLEGYFTSSNAVGSGTAGLFNPTTPTRICDTQAAQPENQCSGDTLGPDEALTFNVAGSGSPVPATGVSAVLFDLTAVGPTTGTVLTAYPGSASTAPGSVSTSPSPPAESNLSAPAGWTLANQVVVAVPPSSGGNVDIYNALGSVDIAVDVNGWFTDGTDPSDTGAFFSALPPARICDTRSSPATVSYTTQCSPGGASATLGPGSTLDFGVAGLPGIPSGPSAPGSSNPPTLPAQVTAVALHVTAVSPTAFSYLTLYPDGAPQPAAPDLDFPAGQNLSNLVVEQVSSSGTINVFNNAGDVDVVVDLVGYYTRVKPDIVGLLDRGSAPTQATGGSNFTAPATLVSSQGSWAGNPISGIVVNETWADLQPTAAYAGTTNIVQSPVDAPCPTSLPSGANDIDLAICDVDQWNNAHPTSPMYIKLRVFAGEDAPSWAKDIGTVKGDSPIVGTSGATIGAFWTSAYEADYADLMQGLAQAYDANPVIEEVVDSACMTQFAEPTLLTDFNTGSGKADLLNAKLPTPYRDYLDYECNLQSVTSMEEAWQDTHISFSFSPYTMLTLSASQEGSLPVSCTSTPCEALTANLMAYFSSHLQGQATLENNSLLYPLNCGDDYPTCVSTPTYASMYSLITQDQAENPGVTVAFQTATMNLLECDGSSSPFPYAAGTYAAGTPTSCSTPADGVSEALKWASGETDAYQAAPSGQSASSVELPTGYMGASITASTVQGSSGAPTAEITTTSSTVWLQAEPGLGVGLGVTGPAIASDTTITAISSSTLTLSAAPASAFSGEALYLSPFPPYDYMNAPSSYQPQTSLSVSTASSVVGQPVTYTATVSSILPGSGIPAGIVTFSGDAGILCTAMLDAEWPDQATCPTSYSATGTDSVTAAYAWDASYGPSTSSAVGETISQDQTTTTLTSSTAYPGVGQPVTFTATVAVSSPGSGTPTGSVAFTDDAGPLCTTTLDGGASDQASCLTTYSAAGINSVTAAYNGDTSDQSSLSPPVAESIGEDGTGTAIASSDVTPVVGEIVTYTATVSPVSPGIGTPTGTVTFTGDVGTLCTSTLNLEAPDQATCQTSYGAPGSDSVSASYGGDPNYAASASSSSVEETIDQDQTTTTLASITPSPVVGQPVTYMATVAVTSPGSGTATGTVTFAGDGGLLCTTALDESAPDQATCVTTYSAVVADSVTATYNGDASDQFSISSPPVSVSIGEDATETWLASTDATPVVGETVTYTATVAADAPGSGTPTGTVAFTGSAGTLCTAALDQASPDIATCSTSYPVPGTDSLTAAYASDGNYLASYSVAADETISMAQTTTAISSSPTSPVVGQPVTYTATVAPVSPGFGTPTGTAKFRGGSGALCSAATLSQASPDVATCTVTYTSAEKDSVTASYSGDSDFAPSTSPTLTEFDHPGRDHDRAQRRQRQPGGRPERHLHGHGRGQRAGGRHPDGDGDLHRGRRHPVHLAAQLVEPLHRHLHHQLPGGGFRLGHRNLQRRP